MESHAITARAVCEEIPVCQAPPELPSAEEPCNGHADFCRRPYDKMVFAATHNAYAARRLGYFAPNANQINGIPQQLRDGIRAFLLDLHGEGAETSLCHGLCFLGRTPHREVLGQFRDFLAEHPREVLTLIYEDRVATDRIEADFLASGMIDFVHTQVPGEPWPTLGEMVGRGSRAVVMGERGHPPPAWYHHLWDLAFDNPFGDRSESEFGCSAHRGNAANSLFLMNHWVNNFLDLPSEEGAARVNRLEVLYPRIMDCVGERRRLPNFIAVNYYEYGDLLSAVRLLNRVEFEPDLMSRALVSLRDMRRPMDFFLFGSQVMDWNFDAANSAPALAPLGGAADSSDPLAFGQ